MEIAKNTKSWTSNQMHILDDNVDQAICGARLYRAFHASEETDLKKVACMKCLKKTGTREALWQALSVLSCRDSGYFWNPNERGKTFDDITEEDCVEALAEVEERERHAERLIDVWPRRRFFENVLLYLKGEGDFKMLKREGWPY